MPIKNTLIAVFTLLAFLSPIHAADLGGPKPPGLIVAEVPAESPWKGPYAGLVAGAAFGALTVQGQPADSAGKMIGGVVGWNFPVAGFLLGLEGDLVYSDVHGGNAGRTVTFSAGQDAFATLRARMLFPLTDKLAPYMTAGLAVADTKINVGGVTQTKLAAGLAAGLGVEYRMTHTINVRAEALYLDFNDLDVTQLSGGSMATRPGIARIGATVRLD